MNKEFKWDEKTVSEFLSELSKRLGEPYIKEICEQFKASKTVPEWEIISYMKIDDGAVFTKHIDNFYHLNVPYKESYFVTHDYWYKINSVKRLSDGEVFTIKDRVDAKQAGIREIKKFFMDDDYCNLWVQFNEGHGSNDGCLGLNSIEKLKPLFTTYDGIDIFDKNELLYVVEHARDVFLFESKSTAGSIRGILKYFYYKEPAEQYVIIHKPCLSISEVIDAGPAHDIDPVLKNNLLKLVKKKIEGK